MAKYVLSEARSRSLEPRLVGTFVDVLEYRAHSTPRLARTRFSKTARRPVPPGWTMDASARAWRPPPLGCDSSSKRRHHRIELARAHAHSFSIRLVTIISPDSSPVSTRA